MAFKKALIERALGAELSHHLGYPPGSAKPQETPNQRNGKSGKTIVTDRRNGATDVRRNGANFWLLNRAPEGVEGRGYFAAFAGVDLVLSPSVFGARYEAPSSTMQ
jgi:hypothetical protein